MNTTGKTSEEIAEMMVPTKYAGVVFANELHIGSTLISLPPSPPSTDALKLAKQIKAELASLIDAIRAEDGRPFLPCKHVKSGVPMEPHKVRDGGLVIGQPEGKGR
ncbi:MAG TPA: hypothetical protein VD994_12855 [Prosthecobacter sp.]|nr:hypothetical protein [Prosthecobacter sp.]